MTLDYRPAMIWLTAGLLLGAVAVSFKTVVDKPASKTIISAEPQPLPIVKKKSIRKWRLT